MNAPVSIVGAVTRGGPAPYKPHAPCPWCQVIPEGAARQCGPVWLVGCDDDDCYNNGICAQASGKTADAAWAAWDRRTEPRTAKLIEFPENKALLEAAASGRGIG